MLQKAGLKMLTATWFPYSIIIQKIQYNYTKKTGEGGAQYQ